VREKPFNEPIKAIDELIAEIPDWRGKTFATVRKTILAPTRRSWRNSSGWEPAMVRDGMIAVANAFKGKVNVTFAYGAKLPTPTSSSIQATAATPRAIDFFEGDKVNERALKPWSAPPSTITKPA